MKRISHWQIMICLIAALPIIFVLVTWDRDGNLTPVAYAIRFLSLPITFVELTIIILAVRSKFSIVSVFKNFGFFVKFLSGIWLVFAFFPIFSSGFKSSLHLLTTMQFVLHALFLAAGIHLARNNEGADRDWALSMLGFGSLAYVSGIVFFALMVPDKLTFPWVFRLPTGTNVRQIGYFAAIASVALASLTLFSRSRGSLYAVAFGILVAFIAWTGSRGALAGLFIGTLVAGMVIGRLPSVTRSLLILSSWVIGLSISALAPNPAPEFGLMRMASSLAQDDVGSGRGFIWESTLSEISKNPWLGHGSGSFNQNMRNIYGFDFNHPHQFMLQFIYDWGVIGGLSAALIILSLSVHCMLLARRRKDAAAYASVAALCVTCAVGMIDGPLFYPFSIFLALSIVIGGFVNCANKGDDGNVEIEI